MCPSIGGQIDYAHEWFDPNFMSSDLFNSCSLGGYAVPNNFTGSQNPYQGSNYAGLTLYWNSQSNYREYIAVRLSQILLQDAKYCFSMYFSLGDSCVYSCDNIYLGLSNDTIGFYSQNIINPTTVYKLDYKDNFSTLNWIKAESSFIATGTEEYIIIGNFNNDLNTNIHSTSGGDPNMFDFTYIYIDSVQLRSCGLNLMPNIFTPNNDGANDSWQFSLNGDENINCMIYNRWGLKIFESSKKTIKWDGRTTSGIECTDGVYFYTIETKEKNYKGHIQLIR